MTRVVAAPRRRRPDGWQLRSTAPGRHASPQALDAEVTEDWVSAPAGTVAAMLRSAGRWSLDAAPRRFDTEDWWLRAHFEVDDSEDSHPEVLHLDGLAGLADLWINGQHVLRSENMFVSHACTVGPLLRRGTNTLHLRFAALDVALAQRRARPRWRVPMLEHQQLRWFRQTLLGRTPGWTPPAAAVGPWRDIWFEGADDRLMRDVDLQADLGDDGVGVVRVCVQGGAAAPSIRRVELELAHAGLTHRVALQASATAPLCWEGCLRIERPALWWPHTHGEPALYAARLRVQVRPDEEPRPLPLHAIGFRRVAVQTECGDWALSINGVPVFCRGACWMPLDVVSLRTDGATYRQAIAQVRDAGMNMLRVSGATVYEEDAFFEACDEAGVLVWQDFMFANMDYPADDTAFVESVRLEATQQLQRWGAHASLAVVCGNSEVEQQAAMWGAPRALWAPPLFHELLRRWAEEQLPGVPYWPSSASGGAFPHQSDVGTSSYYGVGAYLRPQDDVRRAQVRFTTECLGFSNVPEDAAIGRMPGGHALRVHHPAWKARAPRDLGAGWDFEDVRDHYLGQLFGVDALRCRYADHDRYLALSRVVTGELMADAFAEWRRPSSACRGALVWFLRDLWAGAGWGLIDEAGQPKACWYILRRALQPLSLAITEEGGNGLTVHLVNERGDGQEADLHIDLFGGADTRVAQAVRRLSVPGRGAVSLALAELFDGFFDLSYSYRFGPPAVTLVHLRWLDRAGRCVAEAFHFPAGRPSQVAQEMPLTAQWRRTDDGGLALRLEASRFAQSVQVDVEGHTLSDNYFHLAPGSSREIQAWPRGGAAMGTIKGWVRALNSASTLPLRLSP